jgi:hypothetical protein
VVPIHAGRCAIFAMNGGLKRQIPECTAQPSDYALANHLQYH